jgi:three-Cys-motif partner protein
VVEHKSLITNQCALGKVKAMIDRDKFLQPEADGLPTRPGHSNTPYKLKAVATYIKIANMAQRNNPWRDRYYIDLQSGPGKVDIENAIVLGSPLIALTTEHPFTQYRLNELEPNLKAALETRVSASPLAPYVRVYQKNVNQIVRDICKEIHERDKVRNEKWSTFNIAFLDPEGLELKWNTVRQLAQVHKMDLIINFSTNGLLRSIGAGYYDVVDEFFGTNKWRDGYKPNENATQKRRALIDFYLKRLQAYEYFIDIDPNFGGADLAVKNSKDAQLYSLIFASKNQLGEKFWKETLKQTRPPRLPGFE